MAASLPLRLREFWCGRPRRVSPRRATPFLCWCKERKQRKHPNRTSHGGTVAALRTSVRQVSQSTARQWPLCTAQSQRPEVSLDETAPEIRSEEAEQPASRSWSLPSPGWTSAPRSDGAVRCKVAIVEQPFASGGGQAPGAQRSHPRARCGSGAFFAYFLCTSKESRSPAGARPGAVQQRPAKQRSSE